VSEGACSLPLSVTPRQFFETRLKRILASLNAHGRWVLNSPRTALLAHSYLKHTSAPVCVFVYVTTVRSVVRQTWLRCAVGIDIR
jgi:hypothetical protein